MNVRELRSIIKGLDDESEVIVFVTTEDGLYRPFRNISSSVLNENSSLESLHLDVSVFKEFRSIHFPNNLSEDEYEDLVDKRNIVLEELSDIDEVLGKYNLI